MQKGTVYNFYKDLPGWAKGVSVLAVVGIGVITYFGVRKYIKNLPPKVTYPNGGKGIPVNFDAKGLAQKLHDSMSGWQIVPNEREIYLLQLLNLPTNDMFVAVYDVFNQLYMREGKGTLRQWVNDEYAVASKSNLLKRFDQLNLK